MRKIYLSFFGLLCSCFSLLAQNPEIVINQEPINESLDGGESVIIKIPITNTGNRDLIWKAVEFAEPVFFEKKDSANWELTVNQDRLAPDVWITRQNSRGIYNAAMEEGFVSTSPEETLWAYGNSSELSEDDYDTWTGTNEWYPLRMLNRPMSVYLPEYNEYLDLTFHSWTDNARGGGFSYTRSGCAPWLTIENNTGTLIPGISDSIYIILNGANAFGGKYSAEIIIKSNDQNDPEIRIPVHVSIQHNDAEIELSVDTLRFEDVMISDTAFLPFYIGNVGQGELIITSITGKTGAFHYGTLPDTLPGSSVTLKSIYFTPTQLGDYVDTLTISNNSINKPLDTILVSGFGVPHGILAVDTDTIKFSMISHDIETAIINISNTGAADLEWSVNPSFNNTPVQFTKPNYADYHNPVFQDAVSPNLTLTRADNEGIFNILQEESFSEGSPANTYWSFGNTKDLIPDDYTEWRNAVSSNPPSMVNNTISMVCYSDLRFFDMVFKNWTSGDNGGGFSYIRTEVPGWLKASAYNGILAESESVDITVSVDAGLMPAGHHEAYLEIATNNPQQRKILIPVIVDVIGEPQISLDSSAVNFNSTYVGSKDSIQLKIDNVELGTLEIVTLSNDLPEFTTKPESLTILPWQSGVVTVYFNPSATGLFADTLRIASNSADSALYAIPLNGNAILPPVLTVIHETFADTLNQGELTIKPLLIKNTGSIDLNWTIMPEIPGAVVTFTKKNWSDWTEPENQDKISDDIVITRQDNQGLFNIAREYSYSWDYSPDGTLWKTGESNEEEIPMYTDWRSANGGNPPMMVDNPMSMFLPEEYRFFNFDFHSWTENGMGGGFSYTRTEIPVWLKTTDLNGIVAPGDSIFIGIVFDALSVPGGAYKAELSLEANGPATNKISIPVEMLVVGIPEISGPSAIELTNLISSIPVTHEIELTNSGNDTLRISRISSLGEFAEGEPLSIAPNKSKYVEISILPQIPGLIQDTLIIESNAANSPAFKIPITGNIIEMPVRILPAELYYYLPSDTTVYDSVNVKNMLEDEIWLATGTLLAGDSIDYAINVFTENLADSTYHTFIDIPVSIPFVADFIYQLPLTLEVFNFRQTGELTDTTVNEGYGMINIDLSSKFETYRNNAPSFIVVNSNPEIATVEVSDNALQITETGAGQTLITVRADDNYGHAIYSDFVLFVNSAPAAASIPDQTSYEDFGSEVFNLSEYFTDADDQTLTFEVTSSNTGVVTVAVNGSELTITEAGIGISTITVTATDPYGMNVSDEFTYTVNEATGVKEYTADHLQVYPNPSSGIIHAMFNVTGTEKVIIKITDINGRIVYSSVNTVTKEPLELDLSSLDKGFYIMSYTLQGKQNRTKINLTE